MTENDVIQMMRQAGLTRTKYAPSFRRLIEIAVLAEREACANVAAWILKMPENDVSAAIRARVQE
ncbi:MAG: hypothetical protein EBR90_01175 [Actinobacteria bacterium]|nr:hypothetical protein [Actinomycetota bacterium]